MVLDREEKDDVFAGFNIDNAVKDNEGRLEQQYEEEIHKSSEFVNDSVFAKYQLDEIVRKHEERLRREDLEKKAMETEEDDDDSGSIRRDSSMRDTIGSTFHSLGSLLNSVPIQQILSHSSSRENGGSSDNIGLGDEGDSTVVGPDHVGHSNRHLRLNKRKHANSSRSGTTITPATVMEEDEEYFDSDDEVRGDADIEEGESDDDDDSFIGANNSPSKIIDTDVITRSRTGMPIGGMAVSQCNDSAHHLNYRWVSPHQSDTIFSDFDLDAIVKDYEKLHRMMDYAAEKKKNFDDDDDDDGINGNTLDIAVRYRSCKKMWLHNFPRIHAVMFRIILPMLLILVSTVFLGRALANLEIGNEIGTNDGIMRERYAVDNLNISYNVSLEFMLALPTLCFDYYLKEKSGGDSSSNNITNNIIDADIVSVKNITQTSNYTVPGLNAVIDNVSVSTITELAGENFPRVSPDSGPTLQEVESYLDVCKNAGTRLISEIVSLLNYFGSDLEPPSLSFNWMRCWNTTIHGDVNPFRATKEQLKAATDQSAFYMANWNLDQRKLYEQNLKIMNCNSTDNLCRGNAEKEAVAKATGKAMCDINKGASAWFWFVFMTTVGYGNASPSTPEGRTLAACVGLFAVILWAIILFTAGRVLGVVLDDMFRRCRCRFMTMDVPNVLVWGLIAGFWVAFLGELFFFYENYNLDPEEYKYTIFGIVREKKKVHSEIGHGDAYWFSYITLLTVGLGDFYVSPDAFFYDDLLIWTICMLVGFTFLATFLGQLADLINSFFPDSGVSLKERLRNTKVVGKKEVEYKKQNEKGIEKLEKLVEVMDDDDLELLTERVTRIRVKKNLLVNLLYQTEAELEHYKKRGERYQNLAYPRVCQEENMLNEVTLHTIKEREKLEAYRDGRAHSGSGMALPTPGSDNSYLDDGTTLDLVGKKLKLRSGSKSIRKKTRASTYI